MVRPHSPPSQRFSNAHNNTGFLDFGRSVGLGARIILQRKFCWLPLGYSLALYGHRYLENGVAPIVAAGYFKQPAFTQILVGGSNLGELLGATAVLLMGNLLPTPIPWVRVDALLLCLIWVLPFSRPGLKVCESAKFHVNE